MSRALLSLRLAAVARLQLAFEHAKEPALRQRLLYMAADCLDKTRPSGGLGAFDTPADGDQVGFLVRNRDYLEPLEPERWQPARVPTSAWPQGCAVPLRALDRLCKRPDEALKPADRVALRHWLQAALERYPELAPDVVGQLGA